MSLCFVKSEQLAPLNVILIIAIYVNSWSKYHMNFSYLTNLYFHNLKSIKFINFIYSYLSETKNC